MAIGQILGGVLGGASQLISGAFNRRNQNKQAERTFAHNKEMSRYQYNKDLEMWNRNNQYNSPQAQQQRLKDAKLNPNLVWSKGGVENQSSGSLPQYNAPTADFTGVGSGAGGKIGDAAIQTFSNLGQYLDLKTKAASIDHINSQNESEKRRKDLILEQKWLTRQKTGQTQHEREILRDKAGWRTVDKHGNPEQRTYIENGNRRFRNMSIGTYQTQAEQHKIDQIINSAGLLGKQKKYYEVEKGAKIITDAHRAWSASKKGKR